MDHLVQQITGVAETVQRPKKFETHFMSKLELVGRILNERVSGSVD